MLPNYQDFKNQQPPQHQAPPTGALTAMINPATSPDIPPSLRHDVVAILMDCHRSRHLQNAFRKDVSIEEVAAVGEHLARRLGLALGGHYLPKRDAREARDTAVWRAFNGGNHKDVIRDFKISKRLLYNILARKRRG